MNEAVNLPTPDPEPAKPRLRGVLHQWAAWVALVAGIVLVTHATSPRRAVAGGVYAASLVLLFAVSAAYHRIHWQPAARAWMRRADHACIYGLIAGTYTPLAMLALPPAMGRPLLLAVWGGAVLGALKSLFWVRAPKWLSTLIYLGLGWAILPVARPVAEAVGPVGSWLIALGGIAYTLGAVAYVVKRPNPWAGVFGYHELFHAMTLVATGFHFTAVARVVVAAAR